MSRDYDSIEKDIAKTGFFSEYLPPCFGIDKKVFLIIPVEKCDLVEPYCFTMSKFDKNDSRRSIFIPEIGAYVISRNFIRQEQIIKDLVEFMEENDTSFSPILGEDDSIMHHEQVYNRTEQIAEVSSDYIENIAKKIIKSTGAKKILRLDISNCYYSFYLHMIPAILLGVNKAENDYNKYLRNHDDSSISEIYKRYHKLDGIIRRQNLNRTNGLLPGPLMSKIIVEGILTRIDMELKKKGIKFSRYIDDYEVYIYNDEERTTISTFVNILGRYGFALNGEKTEIIEFPYYVAENLEKIFNDHINDHMDNAQLIELFNSYLTLEQNGTKGAIRYLLKSLEQHSIAPTDPALYKAYLLTIIGNNERSLSKACSLLIENRDSLPLDKNDVKMIND